MLKWLLFEADIPIFRDDGNHNLESVVLTFINLISLFSFHRLLIVKFYKNTSHRKAISWRLLQNLQWRLRMQCRGGPRDLNTERTRSFLMSLSLSTCWSVPVEMYCEVKLLEPSRWGSIYLECRNSDWDLMIRQGLQLFLCTAGLVIEVVLPKC